MGDVVKARITGKCVESTPQKFGSGEKEFRFLEIAIQTGVASIELIRVTDSYPRELTPRVGEVVDLEVSLAAYTGRNGTQLNATAVKPFDEDYVLNLLAAQAA